MGHTATSQRQVSDAIIRELHEYGRSLRIEEMPAYERLLAKAKIHFGSISFVSSYNTWAFILVSILLEQEKEIMHLEEKCGRFS
ncbi:MAG: hypothetical protein ABIJ34_08980 [archaeon]